MTASLNELLSDAQCERVIAIVESGESDSQIIKDLKEYLGTLREQLEAKGVLPAYLAYVLIALKNNALPNLQNN